VTHLAAILDERKLTYAAVAKRANLQPRTVRQLATGETPIDQVAVGTVRRIAAALSVSVGALIEIGVAHPGDPSLTRAARLSAAVRDMLRPGATAAYPSPVEAVAPDSIAAMPPAEFFADMPGVDDRRA
jgi:transcriptional regulator with XRE-family HTH domain